MFWRGLQNSNPTAPERSLSKVRSTPKTCSPKQLQIIERVEDCYCRAETKLKHSFRRPQIGFNQRGKIAGSARLQTNELRFNPILLEDNFNDFINEVVPHEICHLLAYQLYGKVRPHGPEWKGLMATLYELRGTSKHQMDVTKVQGKTFTYQCQCQQHSLSIRRHNKITRGMTYQCRLCRSPLQPS
ncbi:SprT family zinc-dependent metalloprotease [Alteromonadaceae bacterium BrNp21-10]|nr:SprT family zinc-dependent metalloprotease [Alteromonadaceae bacterium BrNp21-10]